jgi:3-deoxy-manno-octulosonate cytidylyltransferase (CMP-KDO synthetase)
MAGGLPFYVVIPARFASTRFPGKVLVNIHGKPMIQHVYERAVASGAKAVWVATDDARVEEAAAAFGAQVCMTSPEHQSGSDRLAETAEKLGWADDEIVINVQGDEPLLPPANIAQVAEYFALYSVNMATLYTRIESDSDVANTNLVKVVTDRNGYALYFSRSVIPHRRDSESDVPVYYRHIGIYGFRVGYLKRFSVLEQAPLERIEKLEQLRALWHGERIHVAQARQEPGPGVDTREDLEKLLRNYTAKALENY